MLFAGNKPQQPEPPVPQPAQQQTAPRPAQATLAQLAAHVTETLDGRWQILAGGAEVKDLETGLVWQRCSVGQSWSGSGCTGEAKKYKWDAAQALSGKGWRVPTVRELVSLRVCSKGFRSDMKDIQDGKAQVPMWCADGSDRPTIHKGAFPQTPDRWYWTSSPRAGLSYDAWYVDFGNGYGDSSGRYDDYRVRLVR